MKKLVLALVACASMVATSWSQQQIHDFADWSSPTLAGFSTINGGWSLTSPNIASNVGPFSGSVQFGGAPADLSAFNNGTVELAVDFLSLTNGTTGELVLNIFSATNGLIQSFSWGINSNLAGGSVLLTGNLSGDYSDVQVFELTTSNLTPTQTFSGSFTDLSLVPEPSSFALMGLGMGALYLLRRRK